MQFIPPLFANLQLGAAKGEEDRVNTIQVHKSDKDNEGKEHINWPPVKVDAFIPKHKPCNIVVFGKEIVSRIQLLQYLDLNLIFLQTDPGELEFKFRHYPGAGTNADGAKIDLWDLMYSSTEDNFSGHKYEFGEELDIVGFLKDVPLLQPLKFLYPDLPDDWLILAPKPRPAPRILLINADRDN